MSEREGSHSAPEPVPYTLELGLEDLGPNWSSRPAGACLAKGQGQVAGHRFEVALYRKSSGTRTTIIDAPLIYYHEGADQWAVIGDLQSEPEARRLKWHKPMFASRLALAALHDGVFDAVWAPGLYGPNEARKAAGLGLAELPLSDLNRAPRGIQELAQQSRHGCPRLTTGLFRANPGRVPDMLQTAQDMLNASTARLRFGAMTYDVPISFVGKARKEPGTVGDRIRKALLSDMLP